MAKRPPQRARFSARLELGLAAFAPAMGLLAFRSRHSSWAWLFAYLAATGLLVLFAGAVMVRRGNASRSSSTTSTT